MLPGAARPEPTATLDSAQDDWWFGRFAVLRNAPAIRHFGKSFVFNPIFRQIPRFMAVNRSGCLLATLVVLLCMSVLGNLILLGVAFSSGRMLAKEPPRFEETLVEKGSGDGKIALVQLRGIISSSIAGSLGDSMVECHLYDPAIMASAGREPASPPRQ